MSNSPLKISVVIPLYNKAPYVVEAIESVLSQSFSAHEIIVVDDGSTDDGISQVQALKRGNIRVLQQSNGGVSVARNTGIQAASGEVIAFLDADDRYLPDFLMTIVKLAQDFPKACVLGTGYRRFSSTGQPHAGPGANRPPRGVVDNFYTWWSRTSFFSTSSLAIRAQAFRESGIAFPPGERLGEDQDVWFQMAERYMVVFDPVVHCEYRIDVVGSATHAPKMINLLPCYVRLAARMRHQSVPAPLRQGARRLLSSHYLNTARARLTAGDLKGAWQLALDPAARAKRIYLLRTLLVMCRASINPRAWQ